MAPTLCTNQNIPLFGFIPIYGLKSQVIDKGVKAEFKDILQLHRRLRENGRHNYRGLQILVPSKLNPEKWAKYLQQYWDWQLPLLINSDFCCISTEIVLSHLKVLIIKVPHNIRIMSRFTWRKNYGIRRF